MNTPKKDVFDRIRKSLGENQWQEQKGGKTYSNGTYSTSFYNSAESVLTTVQLNIAPDSEELKDRGFWKG